MSAKPTDFLPLTWRECYMAADRMQGSPARTKLSDADRTGYLPTWAAYRCPDTYVSFMDLGKLIGYAYSSISAKVYAVDRSLGEDDRRALRGTIREHALRAREGRRSGVDPALLARVREVASKDWRYGRGRSTRMNPEMVRSIRASCLPAVMLARFLGMPWSQVSQVRSRRIWSWVDWRADGV